MKIFVINLKRSVKRREAIVAQLLALNLEFEIVEAIDGRTIGREEILSYYQNKSNSLPSGFLACGISHHKVYERIVEEKIPVTLIMEDDVILSKNLPKIIEAVGRKIQDNEVILLHAQAVHPVHLTKSKMVELDNGLSLYYSMPFHGGLGSTAAYFIPFKVAQRFASDFPISFNVDSWGPKLKNNFFESLRVVYPYPVVPAMIQSDINYVDEKTWKYMVKLVLNRIPLMKQVLKFRRCKEWKKSQKQILFVDDEPIAASDYFD